ncbi:MAG: hypothetical protein HQL15_06790 [Candidatus Omnitrophica bacterium]|nr:hypothetical protein [Candidatus Omnitrophota bacterium]
MRHYFRILCLGVLILTSLLSVLAYAENSFKKNNPDGYKYEFARSYIGALKYFYNVNQRWIKNPPKKKFKGDDFKTIRGSIEYLVQDNWDLRVAKNYMVRYLYSPNSLMRKVSDMLIDSCEKDIALNNKAKNLWQDWLNLKSAGRFKPKDEKNFIAAQRDIELKRKESDKNVVEASILMSKVLLSQDNPNDKGKLLVINEKERNKLIDDLDSYGKEVMDWGLKPGQSTFSASIAVIREVLEDPVFITHK